jgi:hypothetical protein
MTWAGGVTEWAKDHNCEFGIKKFQLLDIMRKSIPHPLNAKKRVPMPRMQPNARETNAYCQKKLPDS